MIESKSEVLSVFQKDSQRRMLFERRREILNYLFRHSTFVAFDESIISVPKSVSMKISEILRLDIENVEKIIKKFLLELVYFRRFLLTYKITWSHEMKKDLRKVRVFLHKLHRLAPVFDYRRARINAEILYILMRRKCYFPKLNNQLTLIMFITDLNDKNSYHSPIRQKNLRALCKCSAYAFHRARNVFGINP